MALTAPVSSKESTPCDFKVCNNKTLGYYNLNTLQSWGLSFADKMLLSERCPASSLLNRVMQ